MHYRIDEKLINGFKDELRQEEREYNTICKYMRDIRNFYNFAGSERNINHEVVWEYKQNLQENYMPASVNSILSSLNKFFAYAGWEKCRVKLLRLQKNTFRERKNTLTREEYLRLLDTALRKKQKWLYMLMMTICSTGIRVSEIKFITVESLSERQARIYSKGKVRQVIIPKKLCVKLKKYSMKRGIKSGSIFVTRSGKPIDRSNIHHAMKKLCSQAGVEKEKVFPHNLRHLFAVSYYESCHDLTGLAAFMGHSNINTTRIYTMTTVEKKEKFINNLKLII